MRFVMAAVGVALCGSASAQTTTATAIRTADYLDSIGFNTHVNNNSAGDPYSDSDNGGATGQVTLPNGGTANVTKMAAAMNYMGVHLIRDAINYQQVINRFMALQMAVSNLKITVLTTSAGPPTFPLVTPAQHRTWAQQVWQAVASFDGLNEARDNPAYFPYKGLYGSAGVCQWERDMKVEVNTFNTQNGTNVPMLAASVASAAQFNEMAGDATCTAAADASNGHSYTDEDPPTPAKVNDLTLETKNAPAGAPNWVTETGPITNTFNSRGGDQMTSAKRDLEILLGFKRLGVVKTILYELVDDPGYDPTPGIGSNDTEDHFGLYDHNWNPKAGAQALHNQFLTLNDTAATARTFVPTSLTYTIAAAPSATYSLLMQKSDGTWVLAIWPEPVTWNYAGGAHYTVNPTTNGSPVVNATTTATVTFPTMTAISLVDPFGNGTASTTQTLAAGTTAAVPLNDHPVYLVMAGAAGGAAPPPTGGIGVCTFSGGTL